MLAGSRTRSREPGAGHRIGPYRIERRIGSGGMGTVFLAVRVDEFEKRVAIKLLKPGLSTGAVVRRFRHERQILARLDHPNIAKLLDGGTTEEGLPYFVMEYVEGEPIDRYCNRHRLSVHQRLELFREVCSAVHMAHQNLIVHRDLKPGNILVGAGGEVKLLDFGIAKPLDAAGSSASRVTDSGARSMTLAYASPEQVAGNALTTASDVYSLGVVLYELLTGQRPYRTPSGKWLDLANAIQEQQPRKPSTSIDLASPETETSPIGPGDVPAPEIQHSLRAADRRGLKRRLAGDLDSIVLAALSKQPERRYASVEQFSEDIHRHLEGLPITARKLTFAYRASKFVRRHKIETALAALVLSSNLVFTLYTLTLKNQESRLKDAAVELKNEAVLERDRAEEVSDFLIDLFKAPSPDQAKGEAVTARQLLDRGKDQIEAYRGSQPRLYARLAYTMGDSYYNLGHYAEARQILEDAVADLRRHVDGQADAQLAVIINDLAAVLWAQGDTAGAEANLRESLAMKMRLHGRGAPELVKTLNNLATLSTGKGALEEAERLYREVLDIRLGLDPPVPADVASSRFLIGTLRLDKGDYEGAEASLRQALETRREAFGSEHTLVAVVLNNLGIALQAQGKPGESEATYREALEMRHRLLGLRHPDVAATETNLASLLVSSGRFEEAEPLASQALDTLRATQPGHWQVAYAESVVGSTLVGMGRLGEAEPLLLKSYTTLLETKPDCSRHVVAALLRIIDLYDVWQREHEWQEYQARMRGCATPA